MDMHLVALTKQSFTILTKLAALSYLDSYYFKIKFFHLDCAAEPSPSSYSGLRLVHSIDIKGYFH